MTVDMRLGFEDRQKAEDLEAEMIAAADLGDHAHELIFLRRESAELLEAWADLTTEGHTKFKRAGSGEFTEHAILTAGNLRHVVRTHVMVGSHQRHVAETLQKRNEQLLAALTGCREILDQFTEAHSNWPDCKDCYKKRQQEEEKHVAEKRHELYPGTSVEYRTISAVKGK